MAESAAIATRATRASSAASGRAERTPSARAEVGSKPATVQRWPSSRVPAITATPAPAAQSTSDGPMTSRLPKSRFSTSAPEWKTSEARITPTASAATRTSAVLLS